MSKLWIAFALVACLSFAACGAQGGGEGGEIGTEPEPEPAPVVDPMVGTWEFDTSTAVKAVEAKLAKEPNPMGEMVIQMVKGVKAEMVLAEDDTFVLNMQVVVPMSGAKEDIVAKGTWKLEGEKFIFTTIEENGVAHATPDVKVATYKDGLISIASKGGAPFDMIFKKK